MGREKEEREREHMKDELEWKKWKVVIKGRQDHTLKVNEQFMSSLKMQENGLKGEREREKGRGEEERIKVQLCWQ